MGQFILFVESSRQDIMRYAVGILGSDDDAADVVQDTYLRLWELRDRLDSFRRPKAVAMVIARNLCFDTLRRQKRFRAEEPDESDFPADTLSPHEMMILEERRQTVDRVLAQLTPAEQTLLDMRHRQRLSTAEIARITGRTDGAIRTALSRVRIHVKQIFDKINENETA